MTQNKITRGTLPPLFDRIMEDKQGQHPTTHLLNADELQASIMEELSVILNTRCTVRKVIYEDHVESIPFFGFLDFFGVSDFSEFDATNEQDWPRAARFFETAIKSAEPRIESARVTVNRYSNMDQTLYISVSAFIRHGKLLKEIHFPLALHRRAPSSRKSAA